MSRQRYQYARGARMPKIEGMRTMKRSRLLSAVAVLGMARGWSEARYVAVSGGVVACSSSS